MLAMAVAFVYLIRWLNSVAVVTFYSYVYHTTGLYRRIHSILITGNPVSIVAFVGLFCLLGLSF